MFSNRLAFPFVWLLAVCCAVALSSAEDLCKQPSPEDMAKAAGVTLPGSPWHVANIWWEFEKPVEHFTSLEMDVTIDRDVPGDYNLYISPCGIAQINGLQFYGGIQTNINGWVNKESRERVHRGKGGIFSRWSSDKKTPIGLDHVQTAAEDCLVESAGYEGEFASVRRPFAWTKGTYTWCVTKGKSEKVKDVDCTWFTCSIRSADGQTHEVGSLRFEGTDFTFWPKHSAFVEVYSTAKIPKSGIPKVNVTFGWPRLNGQKVPLKKASAYYPDKPPQDSPDCAWVKTDGENCVVEVGPIFKRDEAKRRHDLELKGIASKRTMTKISSANATVLVDTNDAPDLKEWGHKAGSLCVEWFPKIAALLPSDGFTAPKEVTLYFDPTMAGVAHAAGGKITIAAKYVRAHPDDFGMIVHELTHVVQSHPGGGPGWLVEGIADYIRIVKYEPAAPRPKLDPAKASYKDAYKTTAMFLEWVEKQGHAELVAKLNAALRRGECSDVLWGQITGKSVDEQWKAFASML
ncbi:MAG: basic secretory family protein [Verrucomicrobiaceae bacterium]|nr:basic secretory family protein [Verrucomicrobiaceae bacterium]